MFEHPISDLFKISMGSIKDMIDVNTIVGDRIDVGNGMSVVPVSKVKCAFATGGTDQASTGTHDTENSKYPFGGVTGGTVTITPIAFLVTLQGEVKLLHISEHTHLYEKIIDQIGPFISQMKDVFTHKDPHVTKVEVIDKKTEATL